MQYYFYNMYICSFRHRKEELHLLLRSQQERLPSTFQAAWGEHLRTLLMKRQISLIAAVNMLLPQRSAEFEFSIFKAHGCPCFESSELFEFAFSTPRRWSALHKRQSFSVVIGLLKEALTNVRQLVSGSKVNLTQCSLAFDNPPLREFYASIGISSRSLLDLDTSVIVSASSGGTTTVRDQDSQRALAKWTMDECAQGITRSGYVTYDGLFLYFSYQRIVWIPKPF